MFFSFALSHSLDRSLEKYINLFENSHSADMLMISFVVMFTRVCLSVYLSVCLLFCNPLLVGWFEIKFRLVLPCVATGIQAIEETTTVTAAWSNKWQ